MIISVVKLDDTDPSILYDGAWQVAERPYEFNRYGFNYNTTPNIDIT